MVTVLPRKRPTPIALPIAIIVSWRGVSRRWRPSSVTFSGSAFFQHESLRLVPLRRWEAPDFGEHLAVGGKRPGLAQIAVLHEGIDRLKDQHRAFPSHARRDRDVAGPGHVLLFADDERSLRPRVLSRAAQDRHDLQGIAGLLDLVGERLKGRARRDRALLHVLHPRPGKVRRLRLRRQPARTNGDGNNQTEPGDPFHEEPPHGTPSCTTKSRAAARRLRSETERCVRCEGTSTGDYEIKSDMR